MLNERLRKRKETEAVVITVEEAVCRQQQDLFALLNMVRVMISSKNRGWGYREAVGYNLNDKVPAHFLLLTSSPRPPSSVTLSLISLSTTPTTCENKVLDAETFYDRERKINEMDTSIPLGLPS